MRTQHNWYSFLNKCRHRLECNMPFLFLLSICPGIYVSSGYCAYPLSLSRTKWKGIPTLSYECLLLIFQCIRLMLKIRTYVACSAFRFNDPANDNSVMLGKCFWTAYIDQYWRAWKSTVPCENCRCSNETVTYIRMKIIQVQKNPQMISLICTYTVFYFKLWIGSLRAEQIS